MNDALRKLCELMPPPDRPVQIGGPKKIDHLEFPQDYRELLARYGPGTFDEFLGLLPLPNDSELWKVYAPETWGTALERRRDDEFVRRRSPEFISALRPWGITDNADRLYWRTDLSPDPNAWTVVAVNPRNHDWEEYDGTMTEFLYAVMSRQYVSNVFPEDFPDDNPVFEPYDPKFYVSNANSSVESL